MGVDLDTALSALGEDPAVVSDGGLGGQLRACNRVRSHVDAIEATVLAEMERRQVPSQRGCVDTAGVLKQVSGTSHRRARRRAAVARELERLPRVSDSLAAGQLSFEHAELLADAHRDLGLQVEGAEQQLVDQAVGVDVDEFRRQLGH